MKLFRGFLTICSVLGLLLLSALPSFAHTTLISSVPANDSLVSEWPTQIALTFGEPLATIAGSSVNQVQITNAAAASVSGAIEVNGNEITVKTLPNTANGPVLVNYRVAASDGHVVEGEYAFTFTSGSAQTPPTPAATSTHSSHGGSTSTIIKASTGLVVLALIVGTFVYRRKL